MCVVVHMSTGAYVHNLAGGNPPMTGVSLDATFPMLGSEGGTLSGTPTPDASTPDASVLSRTAPTGAVASVPGTSANVSNKSLFTLARLIESITARPSITPILRSKRSATSTTDIDTAFPSLLEKRSNTVAGVTITI